MIVDTAIKKITRSEYYKMAEVGIIKPEDKVELLDGIIYLKYPNQNGYKSNGMSPIKSQHAGVVTWLNNVFASLLGGKAFFIAQNPVVLNDNSEPEPDFMVLESSSDFYRNYHPKPKNIYLLIEVSDSTLRRDKNQKLKAYAKSNIAEYWVINLVDNCVEVFKQPKNGQYKSHQIFEGEEIVTFERFDISFKANEILGIS